MIKSPYRPLILVSVASKYSECITLVRSLLRITFSSLSFSKSLLSCSLNLVFMVLSFLMLGCIYFNSQKNPLMQTVSLHYFSPKEASFNVIGYNDVALLKVSVYFHIYFSIKLCIERWQHIQSYKKIKLMKLNRSLLPTYNTHLKSLQVFSGYTPCFCKIDIDLFFPTVLSIRDKDWIFSLCSVASFHHILVP